MPAERAGYTVTMFLVDVSPSMRKLRSVELPDGPDGEERSIEMTNLEWSLQFVMLKIQEMIFNGRKTEQCGVILFGTDDTHNVINEKKGGYEHVSEFIPIGQPHAGTLAKLASLTPSETIGDPVDALIVGIETQHNYLANKKTWTRKMVLLTDGENPIEVEDWEAIVGKMKALDVFLTVVGVDFDDEEIDFREDDKSHIKSANEAFFHKFTEALDTSVIGTLSYALQEVTKPDIKQTKSALLGTTLRLGNPDDNPHEALEIAVKTSKCTAVAHPKSWKRFGIRKATLEQDGMEAVIAENAKGENAWAQLQMRTEYVLHKDEDEDETVKSEEDADKMSVNGEIKPGEKLEKEMLVRGYKYGSSYAPCPEGQYARLTTKKGIDICGFIERKKFRREHAMGEVHYVWADPAVPFQQVTLSSLVQAMEGEESKEGQEDEEDKGRYAVARWVSRDGADPKMGVLAPCLFEKVDCLLWVPMPFADDVRRYNFSPLENLFNKRGERLTEHPYIPTGEQMRAMDKFVDAMDLMQAGEKNEDGTREPWFDTRLSYNPAIHRVKQALFHGAVVQDLVSNPLPPPHPEITKYFEPPKRVVKKAREAVEDCQKVFNVKEVPKRAPRARKDDHVRAQDDEDEILLLDRKPSSTQTRSDAQLPRTQTLTSTLKSSPSLSRGSKHFQLNKKGDDSDDSITEPESDGDGEELLARKGPATANKALPSPTPSPEPDPGRAPGRIVGTTAPLADFRQNVSRGDVVSKAVEDLGWAVKEVVTRPFASRRTGELLDCLKELRDVCLQEDEIAAWNRFLPELKEACSGDPGNEEFWQEIQKKGRAMSLISDSEAGKQGGSSDVSDQDAEKFLR